MIENSPESRPCYAKSSELRPDPFPFFPLSFPFPFPSAFPLLSLRHGLLIGATLVSLAVWGRRYLRREMRVFSVRDALLTAANAIHLEVLDDPTADRDRLPDRVFLLHHCASVSPVWLDSSGRPIDAWGTPFRTILDRGNPPGWVRCESAGPDKEFGPPHDLVESSQHSMHEWPRSQTDAPPNQSLQTNG